MIKVDDEFQSLIPPLTADEYTQLEKNIIKDGIRDPLVVWSQDDGNDILIDGHNRWKISAAHGGIPFRTVSMNFGTRDAVKLWIIRNQKGRRNLNPLNAIALSMEEEKIVASYAKERQGKRTDLSNIPKKSWESTEEKRRSQRENETARKIAKEIGMSEDTYRKGKVILTKGDDLLIQQVRSGETSINRAYNTVMGIEKPKTPQQSKKDLIDHLKQKHEAFEEKKSNGVVQFSEIKQDKNNQEFIAKDLLIRCMRMGDAIERIMFENEQGDVSLAEMAKIISKTDREKLEGYIQKIKNTLSEILMEVVIE